MLIEEAWSQLALQHGVTTDLPGDLGSDVLVRVPGWPDLLFDVKVFTAPLTPNSLIRLRERHHPGAIAQLLVVVPAASENLLSVAESAGVSVLVAPPRSGVPVEGILVGPDGRALRLTPPDAPGNARPRRRGRVPWGTFAVAFELLGMASGRITQQELADRLELSQARVSQILRDLETAAQVRSRDEARLDRRRLARWLADHYPGTPRAATTWLTLDPPASSTLAAHGLLAAKGVQHAVSGQVAADWLAPWERPQTAWIWSSSLADLSDIGATPVEPQEAMLTLAVAQDPYLLRTARRDKERPPVLAPWRVWVDLHQQGHHDAAGALERALIRGTVR